MIWTAFVVTCPFKTWVSPLEKEIQRILRLWGHDTENLLVVPDPGEDEGAGVGSGGATLNALLVATEHLSARLGHTTVVPDLLYKSRILIIHLGPALLPVPTGLLYIPDQDSVIPTTNLERTLRLGARLMAGTCGILVASADILLDGDLEITDNFQMTGDIVLPTVKADQAYATRHGVVTSSKDKSISNILYQPSREELRATCGSGEVDIISGLVWFSPLVAESLVRLYSLAPVDACTYMGADSGAGAQLAMSLWYDLLPAACPGVTKTDFEEGLCGKLLRRGRSCSSLMKTARKEVWHELRRYRIWRMNLNGLRHKYLNVWNSFCGSELMDQWRRLKDLYHGENHLCKTNGDTVIINSNQSHPSSCMLLYNEGMDKCSMESMLNEDNKDLVRIVYPTRDFGNIVVSLDANDDIHKYWTDDRATYLGLPWPQILRRREQKEEDIWVGDAERTLMNARVFSGHSLKEIIDNLDLDTSFNWRNQMNREVFCNSIRDSLSFRFQCKYQFAMNMSVVEEWNEHFLITLDKLALHVARRDIEATMQMSQEARTSKLASLLAMTADLLGCLASDKGGLRSGPAHNKDFAPAISLLEAGDLEAGLEALMVARSRWLDTPSRLIRAARHYEGCVQLLIHQTVLSARDQVRVTRASAERPPVGVAVVSSCPARLDLSGGWTDTPPICYEMGGKVVDLAIQVDNRKPIGCKVVRRRDYTIHITLDNGNQVHMENICDMKDYCNPGAPGALIKCCLIAAGLVTMEADKPLDQQLEAGCGGGLDISLWSDLPQGSGLGTSSILAGACLASLWTAAGLECSRSDLVHGVLVVEQLLTTGGGWQDQVGGLHPGLSLGCSAPSHQVAVTVTPGQVSQTFIDQINSRLVLLFTGKPRLAKNLLQNVIRNWYSQESTIVQCFKSNYKLAEKCWSKVIEEDLTGVGECLSSYWEIKRTLAPGSEPQLVTSILDTLKPFIVGGSLAGAGGGGFLAAILREGADRAAAVEEVRRLPGTERLTFHTASVDTEGITVRVGEERVTIKM